MQFRLSGLAPPNRDVQGSAYQDTRQNGPDQRIDDTRAMGLAPAITKTTGRIWRRVLTMPETMGVCLQFLVPVGVEQGHAGNERIAGGRRDHQPDGDRKR